MNQKIVGIGVAMGIMLAASAVAARAQKRYKPEEIVAKLRQVNVLVSQGQNMVDAIRRIGVRTASIHAGHSALDQPR